MAATRERAEAILDTIRAFARLGSMSASSDEAGKIAEELGVPEAIIWAGLDQRDGDDIDALVGWWPRKEA